MLLVHSEISKQFAYAFDPLNDGALDIGRGRTAIVSVATTTADARDVWRASRLLEQAIQDLEHAKALLQARFEQLEGRA